ncbi:universal stress protein [Streptomyces europaeiscabiei]|uniref:universal stress protein n=1 Tax=Streptomyces europaeiscabiei TaxID=146819 RepID=UPI0029A68C36|nr:universal stress protein [Streptomyces europaeiscabiei]MDX2770255.1 universal stress protein [Streptomyces europaeiscabiei]
MARTITVGMDGPDESLAAAGLRVVHGRSRTTCREPADVLRPWQDKFPGVAVTEEALVGDAGAHLVDASRGASLVVVGRRTREGSLGPRLGPVAHEVLARRLARRGRTARLTAFTRASGATPRGIGAAPASIVPRITCTPQGRWSRPGAVPAAGAVLLGGQGRPACLQPCRWGAER